MKKQLSIFLILLITVGLCAQENEEPYSISLGKWNLKYLGLDNLYPSYTADPLGVRFEVSAQNMLYSDFDQQDEINNGGDYLGKLNITPGVRFAFFKFTSKKNPKLGAELDLGISIPVMMRAGNHDMIGTDGIYYLALAVQPTEWLSLRFSKHHICTHVGDELPTAGVVSPVDYDVNLTQLPVRDDFILSAAIRPLWFLNKPQLDILMIYGDFGFFMPGVDFLGTRQNKPHKHAYYNYQGGAELEYYFKNAHLGGLIGAINVSAYQLNAFSPNISLKAGYVLPQEKLKRKMNLGINYYNGRSISNQFYNRKEKWIAFYLMTEV